MERRNLWRVVKTAFAGNLLVGAVSNLVFAAFFDMDKALVFFLTALLPWSLFNALIFSLTAAVPAWMMSDQIWHPRWHGRLLAGSLLWGLTSCIGALPLIKNWLSMGTCGMLVAWLCIRRGRVS
ncbi:hypothetical protein ACG2K1_08220 [Neisseria sp. 23W00296]|uniref:hypothetical protein n=1 Tax=unclassified Neisseria TaxID=2623750 RepID=UPI00375662D4